MEKVYRKVKKGKRYVYEPYGYNNVPELTDGIWLIQHSEHSRSQTSLIWKVGDLKRPVDIVTHASLQILEDDLSRYLLKLSDENSEEYKEAKETIGWPLNTPPIYNVSPSAIVTLFIREIAKNLEEGTIINIDSEFHKFRDTLDYNSSDFGTEVRVLYKLSDWLRNNNYYLHKK